MQDKQVIQVARGGAASKNHSPVLIPIRDSVPGPSTGLVLPGHCLLLPDEHCQFLNQGELYHTVCVLSNSKCQSCCSILPCLPRTVTEFCQERMSTIIYPLNLWKRAMLAKKQTIHDFFHGKKISTGSIYKTFRRQRVSIFIVSLEDIQDMASPHVFKHQPVEPVLYLCLTTFQHLKLWCLVCLGWGLKQLQSVSHLLQQLRFHWWLWSCCSRRPM